MVGYDNTSTQDLERQKFQNIGGQPAASVVPMGSSASGATDSGNPVKIGLVYNSTPPTITSGQRVDGQANSVGALMSASLDSFYIVKASPAAFDGGTTNARGDEAGTSDPLTLFTVTGDVLVGVYGVCTTDLVSAGGGSVSVGLTGNTTLMIPATLATSIDASALWMDGTPAIGKPVDSLTYYLVGNGVDIVEEITTADVTAGQIYYIALWKPLSTGSSVVAV